jgi:uncharacterized protein (TIGR00645 family)
VAEFSLKKVGRRSEDVLEQLLFASRWILAPFYLGLAVSLLVLLVKFVAELGHLVVHAFGSSETEVILGVLALVDLSLTASLIVIVIFSGYENFVSKIDHSGHVDWPEWMGTIDFTALKLKLLSSIVAISAIQLLKSFMEVKTLSDREIMWLVIIHVVFVVSSVLLALSDRIAAHNGGHAGPAKGSPPDKAGHGEATEKGKAGANEGGKPAVTEAVKPVARPASIVVPGAGDRRRLH